MGKGDTRRPTLVDDDNFARNWCANFGHRFQVGVCVTCGLAKHELTAKEQLSLFPAA